MIQFSAVYRWATPLLCLVILFLIYPKVRNLDRERKIRVAVSNMQDDVKVENLTDAGANEIQLLQEKMNQLLEGTNGSISINRSGNIVYTVMVDEETYEAVFFVGSVDYYVATNQINGQCKTNGCVNITKDGDSENIRETNEVTIQVLSAEQADRLILLLREYEGMSTSDQHIDKGLKRRFKRFFDKIF